MQTSIATRSAQRAFFTQRPVGSRALRIVSGKAMAQLSQDELKKQVSPDCSTRQPRLEAGSGI